MNIFAKKVRVITNSGRILVGTFEAIDRPYDNGYNELSIEIKVTDTSIEEVLESEIKKLKNSQNKLDNSIDF